VTAAPIEIRGVTGYEVPPSTETGDRTRLTWSERGYDYSLSFPSSISTSEGVEIAESLHVADRSEVESMLFPDWAPNFATTHGPIESPPSPTLAIDGSSARGAIVTLTVNGLDRYESQQVDLELFSDGPATTLSGGNRIASMGLARSMVDADGQVVVTVALPNALSAADDIVPLDPGGKYLLRVDVPGQSIDLPFPIAAAQVGVPYRVAPSLGADECGGPPVVIAFDGMEWVPDVGSGVKVFGVSGEGQGGFTLTSENSARFETDGGATIDFVPTPNTTVC
jgi:hypothetical protein